MSVKSQELSPEERGKQALDFISAVRVGLNATPEYVAKVLDDVWNRRIQTTPRHYGITFQRGLYVYHVNPFVSHTEPRNDEGRAALQVSKYTADRENKDHDQALVGTIHIGSSWLKLNPEDDNKVFNGGSAQYFDQEMPFPGTKDFGIALQKGKELIADMTNPIRF